MRGRGGRVRTAWRAGARLVACAVLLAWPTGAAAQGIGQPVVGVVLEQEGRPLTDPLLAGLIDIRVGQPLSMAEVRDTIRHLTSLNRFEDVQAFADPVPGGVRLRFALFPLHPVDRVEFRGMLGLAEDDLRTAVVDRFSAAPAAARAGEVAEALRAVYESRGYPRARVTPRVEETHQPDRATLVFEVESGPRSLIRRVTFDQLGTAGPAAGGALSLPAVREGQPYDTRQVERELQRYETALRARGYYEARATHSVEYADDGGAAVVVAIDRGPRVTVAFAGDPLPEADRERLVPVRAEASADQDLLEDASRAITDDLHARGYRDARVAFTREERGDELVITFDIRRGPRHRVREVAIVGNATLPREELLPLVGLSEGQPFVQAVLDSGAVSIGNLYRQRGFTRAMVTAAVTALPGGDGADEREVDVRLAVTEGVRTLVSEVVLTGNVRFPDEQLRSMLTTVAGRPFSEVEIATDRDRLDLEYRNLGYDSVVVQPAAALLDGDTRARVTFTITEGPQVFVDHVIIAGNERTSTATIQRELQLRPGEPLGYAARIESQRRLAALGLFRRVRIEELRHSSEPRRDVLVQVEEAPPTTLGYGGGVEAATRLRTGDDGRAEERFEVAPRGFFEIGRRNMWGKNRSVNLFTRVSLRARDILVTGAPAAGQPPVDSNYGFNEYRVVGQFREPRVFNSAADLLVTGIVDQAIRSSFNFIRRQARSEVAMRLARGYSVSSVYSFERTELFDERFAETEKPLIDRVFPQVRLSKFSGSLLRDTRTDVVDTLGGSLVVVTADLAARAIGSEVGYVKSYVQAFKYVRLPTTRRVVLATGARIGAAQGFAREFAGVGVVQDLPASERFFAGGDTTVRGFSLDRLGTSDTISPSGFPTGGNGVIILNAELRVGLLGAIDVVTFVDAGNVFKRASDIDVTDLRPAAGFGFHYRSPVGPIRVETGFNLDRRELVAGRLERGYVLHISLGRAF